MNASQRLEAGKLSNRHALHFRDGLANLAEDTLLLILRQRGPCLLADDPAQPGDDEIRPLVALAFEHDFRDRYADAAVQLQQRRALRGELMAQQRRKDLQHKGVIEGDDEIGPGREPLRIGMRQSMTACDVERRAHGPEPRQVQVHRSRPPCAAPGQGHSRLTEARQ